MTGSQQPLTSQELDAMSLITGKDLLEFKRIGKIKEPEFVLDKTIPRGEITFLLARPGDFKSMFALSLGLHVATGTQFLGLGVKQGGVIFIDEEGDYSLDGERAEALTNAMKDEGCVDVEQKIGAMSFKIFKSVKFTAPNIIGTLISWADQLAKNGQQPNILIFDAWIRFFEGNENSSEDVSKVYAVLKTIARKLNCAILIIHHSRKMSVDNRGKAIGAEDLRGSGDLLAMASSVLVINRKSENKFILSQEKQRHSKGLKGKITFQAEGRLCKDGTTGLFLELVKEEPKQKAPEKLAQHIWENYQLSKSSSFTREDISVSYGQEYGESTIERALRILKEQGKIKGGQENSTPGKYSIILTQPSQPSSGLGV